MVKKKSIFSAAVIRDDQSWGTRLLLRPFPGDAQYQIMEIQADIEKPTETRKLTVMKFRFSGVPVMHPFNMGQARIWLNAIEAVADQAKEIEDAMKAKKKSPAKRGAKK